MNSSHLQHISCQQWHRIFIFPYVWMRSSRRTPNPPYSFSYTFLYSALFRLCLIESTLHATSNFPAQAPPCHSFLRGKTSSHLNSLGSIQVTRLPLGAVNLFGMHIILPLTINAGTHFTYPKGMEG